MSNSLTLAATSYEKNSGIADKSILVVFILLLLGSIQNIERETVIPFIPEVLTVTLIGNSLFLLITRGINIAALRTPLFIGINLFSLFIFFSTFYSKYPLLTASRTIQYLIVTNSLYLILSHVSNLKVLFEKIAKITILFTLSASLYGIIVYHLGTDYTIENITVTGINFLGIEFTQRMYGHRISSFLGNPNPFGVQIMVSVLACLYLLKQYKNRKYGLLIIVFLYTLLLTGSRASTIALICGMGIFINYNYIKNNLLATAFRIFLTGLSVIVCGYLLLHPEIIKDIFSLMGRASNTLSGRELAWAALIEQIKENPYLGVGYRISTEAVLEDNFINVSNSHNLYLSILSEIGVFGLLMFIFIYVAPVVKFFLLNKNRRPILSLLTSVCILTSLLVNQLFEDMFAPLSYFFIWSFFVLFVISKHYSQGIPFNRSTKHIAK